MILIIVSNTIPKITMITIFQITSRNSDVSIFIPIADIAIINKIELMFFDKTI